MRLVCLLVLDGFWVVCELFIDFKRISVSNFLGACSVLLAPLSSNYRKDVFNKHWRYCDV